MKKLALLLFVAIQAISVNAQQTINFNIAYKPNMSYKLTNDQLSVTSISYGADMEPMEQEMNLKTTNVIKTGKAANNAYPFTMSIEMDKDSEAAAMMPNGATLKGTIKQSGTPEFEGIDAPGMPEEQKTAMMATMKALATQFIVPARKVKVGESFVIDTPMDVPAGPMTMKMNTKTTYKLIKVEGKKAFFDLVSVIDITANMDGEDMKGTGSGTGSIVYDIDNNFFTEQNMKTTTKMDFKVQGMEMSMSSTQDVKTKVDISANK